MGSSSSSLDKKGGGLAPGLRSLPLDLEKMRLNLPSDFGSVAHIANAAQLGDLDWFLKLHPLLSRTENDKLSSELREDVAFHNAFWLVPPSAEHSAAALVVSSVADSEPTSADWVEVDGMVTLIGTSSFSTTSPSFSSKKKSKAKKKAKSIGSSEPSTTFVVSKVLMTDGQLSTEPLGRTDDLGNACAAAIGMMDRAYLYRGTSTGAVRLRNAPAPAARIGTTHDFSLSAAGLKLGCYSLVTDAIAHVEWMISAGWLPVEEAPPINTSLDRLLTIGLMMTTLNMSLAQPLGGFLAILPGHTTLLTPQNTPPAIQGLVNQLKSLVFRLHHDTDESTIDALRKKIVAWMSSKESVEGEPQDTRELIHQIAEVAAAFMSMPFARQVLEGARSLLAASPVMTGEKKLNTDTTRRVVVHANDGYFVGHYHLNVDPSTQSLEDVKLRAAQLFQGKDACTGPTGTRGVTFFNVLGEPVTTLSAMNPSESFAVNLTGEGSFLRAPVAQNVTVPSTLEHPHSMLTPCDVNSPDALQQLAAAEVPLVPGNSITGNIGDVQDLGIHQAMDKWIRGHGDIVRVNLIGNETYAVRRACFAMQVMDARNKQAPFTNIGGGWDGIFFADGDYHCALRNHFNPQFYDSELRKMFPGLLQVTSRFVRGIVEQSIEGKRPFDMWDWSVRLFFDSMAEVGLGCPSKAVTLIDPEGKEPELLRLFAEILDLEKGRQIAAGAGVSVLNSLPTSNNRAYERKTERIYKLAEAFVSEYETNKAKSKGNPGAPPCFLDACSSFPSDSCPFMRGTGGDEQKRAGVRLARAQVLNFLRAGSDTSAAALTWTTMLLSLHPKVEAKLVEEIDKVFPTDDVQPTVDNIQRASTPYLDAVIKEAMRLHPPANVLLRGLADPLRLSAPPEAIGHDGKVYFLPKGARVLVDIIGLHKDPRYFRNPDVFDPERFADASRAAAMEHGQYIPFGGGPRTCIGNLFGIMEVKVAIIELYRHYTCVHMGDPITVRGGDDQKPATGSRLMLRRRVKDPTVTAEKAQRSPVEAAAPSPTAAMQVQQQTEVDAECWVLFGGNQGTCEGIALEAAKMCATLKLKQIKCCPLDEVTVDGLLALGTTPRLALIVCSTYNGLPPTNATAFCKAAKAAFNGANTDRGSHLQFAVLGCGNSNWGTTYQRVPHEVDKNLARCGAQRVLPFAVGDGSEGDGSVKATAAAWVEQLRQKFIAQFKISVVAEAPPQEQPSNVGSDKNANSPSRSAEFFGGIAVLQHSGDDESLGMEGMRQHSSVAYNTHTERSELARLRITKNEVLSGDTATREVRHIEVDAGEASAPLSFDAGDHLEVGAVQSEATVEAMAEKIGLQASEQVRVVLAADDAVPPLGVPLNQLCTVSSLIEGRDLRVSPALLGQLAPLATDSKEQSLLQLAAEMPPVYASMFTAKGVWTWLELWSVCPSLSVTLAAVLALTRPLQHRFYSISSTRREPLSLTVGVVEDERPGDLPNYCGIASTALATLPSIRGRVVATDFRLPKNPSAAVIMVAGGTGIAPMRGFLQELESRRRSGASIPQVRVYFGCRNEDEYPYRELLKSLSTSGVCVLRVAMSRSPQVRKQYVQDLLREDAEEIGKLLRDSNAHVYVCGGANTVGTGTTRALEGILAERNGLSPSVAAAQISAWMDESRLQLDVWGQ